MTPEARSRRFYLIEALQLVATSLLQARDPERLGGDHEEYDELAADKKDFEDLQANQIPAPIPLLAMRQPLSSAQSNSDCQPASVEVGCGHFHTNTEGLQFHKQTCKLRYKSPWLFQSSRWIGK
jgi:hypothetical protein